MLIVALVLAVIGLAALVAAVVTSIELIAWICIVASAIGVLLLVVDALRERSKRDTDSRQIDDGPVDQVDTVETYDEPDQQPTFDEDYPDEVTDEVTDASEHHDDGADEEHTIR